MSALPTNEPPRRLKQFWLLVARHLRHSSSAKRMNVNSRGRQPTEHRHQRSTTLKGSNNKLADNAEWTRRFPRGLVRPLQGRNHSHRCSMGFTHGYSSCSPSANGTCIHGYSRGWPSAKRMHKHRPSCGWPAARRMHTHCYSQKWSSGNQLNPDRQTPNKFNSAWDEQT